MFTKEMSILDALQNYPNARKIFQKHGMACLECMGAIAESIETGANMHGIDIDKLIEELNTLKK